MKAQRMDTKTWYDHTRTWEPGAYCDAAATITPDQVGASEAHPWRITLELGDLCLEPGDHVAVEVHVGWTADRGRPYLYGRQPFRENWNPGYNGTPKFAFPDGVTHEFAISEPDRMNRYFILDAVVTAGCVPAGDGFDVFLADPAGTLLRCPWFAQDTPVPVAIRKAGEELYRRLRRIPVVQVKGGQARLWKVAATPQPGAESVRLQVIAADLENLNPAASPAAPEFLACPGWQDAALEQQEGYHGAHVWRGTVGRAADASARVEALNRESGLYGRSNPVAPRLHRDLQVYFGDLHGQSERSIGYGTEREYFAWARDAELLDFAAPANHYGGRETVTPELWQGTLDLCDEFMAPGVFATLYGYEWGGGQNAHRNVYYAGQPGQLLCPKDDERVRTIQQLWNMLDEQDLPVLTIPHHTKFLGRIDWAEHHPRFQRLVEVCSCWGNSEKDGPHSVQAGLAMGHRLGVVGGTDTHFSQPGRPVLGPFDLGGLTAALAPRLDRGELWQALHQRRCYATTGERILLDFRVNGELMGSELAAGGPRQIQGTAIGTSPLTAVEIIRNNQLWRSLAVDGDERLDFALADDDAFASIAATPSLPPAQDFVFYYLRVRQADRHWAMSSPIWVVAPDAAEG